MKNEHHSALRACSSDDKKSGNTNCINYDDDFGYPEMRIHNADWESSIFFAWIMQIILMEVLHVPATVGLNSQVTAISSFYSPRNTLEYSSKTYGWEGLRDAGACEETEEDCVHVLPEVWNGQVQEWTKATEEGYITKLTGNGQIGKMSWYIPAFMMERDPSLASFYGLQGEQNRQKLADTFLKPTTWAEYCEEESPNNCSTPDATAMHYPDDISSGTKYFVESSYTGYFRATAENNCTAFPDTCIGHFIAPPCRWSTNVDAQLYWNDISLKPTGPLHPNGAYEYGHMLQIWRAANATKSNVIMWWWSPETLNEEFYKTDAELQQVLLPRATYQCSLSRPNAAARCSEDPFERRGAPLGSCDQEAHSLRKVISRRFVQESMLVSEALRSPAAEFLQNVQISDLEIDTLLRAWVNKKVDLYGNDAREAVCSFVNDNLQSLLEFVPRGYPRTISNRSPYDTSLMKASTALAAFAAFAVLVMSTLAYRWRKTRVFVYAQTHIIAIIMVGFFLISVAAILTSLQPTNAICIAQSWFVTLGYTVELVPLLVKVAAINKILASAQKMKRVSISQERMRRHVLMVVAVIIIVMIIWSVIDPPLKVEENVISDGSITLVETSVECASQHELWVVGSLVWQGILLLAAAVLAYQSRDIVFEFNESRSLGMMIYSHVVFLVLRAVVYNLGQSDIFPPNVVAGVTSTLLSLDTLAALCIYLVPKCFSAQTVAADDFAVSSSHEASRHSREPGLRKMRSSRVVSEIETRAAAAQQAYMSTSISNNLDDSGIGAGGSSADSFRLSRENRLLRSGRRISDIKEMSAELEAEVPERGGSSETEPGSSETETGGESSANVAPLPPPDALYEMDVETPPVSSPRLRRKQRSTIEAIDENKQSVVEPHFDEDAEDTGDYLEEDIPKQSTPGVRKRGSFLFNKRASEGNPKRRSSLIFGRRGGGEEGTPRRSSMATPKRKSDAPRRSSLITIPKRASLAAPPGHEIYITQEVSADGKQIFTPRMRPVRSSIDVPVGRPFPHDSRPRSDFYVPSDDSDEESVENEDHDEGGPRYTSASHNKALDKAVRRTSAPNLSSWRDLQSKTKGSNQRHSSFLPKHGPPMTQLGMLGELEDLEEVSSAFLKDNTSSTSLQHNKSGHSVSGPLDNELDGDPASESSPAFKALDSDVLDSLDDSDLEQISTAASRDGNEQLV